MAATTLETVLTLACADDSATRRNLEDFAVLLCDQARRRGCKARASWVNEGVRIRLQSGCAESFQDILESLATSAAEQGASISIGEDHTPGRCIQALEDAPIPWGTVVQARLTRELLCALPEGAFVAAEGADGSGASVGRLGPFHVRAQQWKRAQLFGLDGGMCRVFWSENDYHAFVHSGGEEEAFELRNESRYA